ncbi:M48 family metalloprotease [Cryptosporangium aurantiacum]
MMPRSQSAYFDCVAPAERLLGAFRIGGAAGLGIASVAGIYVLLAWKRRRQRLCPTDHRAAPAVTLVTQLAARLGVRRVPRLLISARIRDPFSTGTPGRTYLVLPVGLLTGLRKPGFNPAALCHELAHVRHRDVVVSHLAKSLGWIVAPVLLLSVLGVLLGGEPGLATNITVRAVLLMLLAVLVGRSLLRAREFDADLRAASVCGPSRVAEALQRNSGSAAEPRHRLVSNHPRAAERVAVLSEPGRYGQYSFLAALPVAFFAALAVDPVTATAVSLFMGVPVLGALSNAAGALVVGPFIGATLGLGLWRQALVARTTFGPGTSVGGASAAAGVFVGTLLGNLVSVAQTAVTWPVLADRLPALALYASGLAGATLLAAGVAALWADAAPRFRRARASWTTAVVLAGALYIVTIWLGGRGRVAGTRGFDAVLTFAAHDVRLWIPPALLLGALALAALWASACWRTRPWPSWAVESGQPAAGAPTPLTRLPLMILTGCASGALGGLALVAYRLLAGPAAPGEQLIRFHLFLWAAGLCGAIAGLLHAFVRGPAGFGEALIVCVFGSTTACLCMMVGILGPNIGIVEPGLALHGIVVALGAGLVGLAVLGPLLVVSPAQWRSVRALSAERPG